MTLARTARTALAGLALAGLAPLALAACGDDDTDDGSAAAVATVPGSTIAGGATTTAGGVAGPYAAPAADAETTPDTDAPADTAGATAAANEIVISGFAFGDPIEVSVGDVVTVRNADTTPHTWTAADGSFDSGAIEPGGSFEFTFEEPGTFEFACGFHPSMTGSITVVG